MTTTDEPDLEHDARCTHWRSNNPNTCTCRDDQGKTPRDGRTWADGAWIAFDTETTGVDVDNDRIVTATLIVHRPGQQLLTRSWLADPGVDIADETAAIHGITTDHARTHGQPADQVTAEIAHALLDTWSPGCPLIGYNIGFDLSILAAELRRHHNTDLPTAGPVIDPLVIDRRVDRYRRGSRKLVDVCRHYGITLTDDDAHSADADALAAARLAWKIARTYPDQIGTAALADLHTQQIEWHRTWADGLGAYLVSKGKPDDVQREWPMRGTA